MTNDQYVVEATNLFAGDHDPSASRHLSITDLKLPALQRVYADHAPGGSPFQIEVAVGVTKLEATFNLAGFDPELLALFGINDPLKRRYTTYETFREISSGKLYTRKALIEGDLGKNDPSNSKRGEMGGGEYAINAILHYEVYWEARELLFWDFKSSTWRADGVDVNAESNRRIGIA